MHVVEKAFACLVRTTGGEPELLVFDHPLAGTQLPKGSIEPGEERATAALRELEEETGIGDARLVEQLLPHGLIVGGVRQIWRAWIAVADSVLPDAWEHAAQGSSEERGLRFGCRFVPVDKAVEALQPIFAPVAQAVAGSAWVANALWRAKAGEWDAWIGEDGDTNRRANSDPVLWGLLGDVGGQAVLDAGCGTGYLAAHLAAAGAEVVAIDAAPEMVALTRERAPAVAARVDDLETLATCADATFDVVVNNYVLMDLPDLEAACSSMARVLRPGGRAVVVFSHPCFVSAERLDDHTLRWSSSYLGRWFETASWGPFTTRFAYWHRPLADYLRAFREAGLTLDAFEEPALVDTTQIPAEQLARAGVFPYSVVVRLVR